MYRISLLAILAVTIVAIGGCKASSPPAPAPQAAPVSEPAKAEPAPQPAEAPKAAEEPQEAAAAPAADDAEVEGLFNKACSSCHSAEKAKKYKGNETWKTVVDRMVDKRGAKVSDEDRPKIIAYLDKTYPKK